MPTLEVLDANVYLRQARGEVIYPPGHVELHGILRPNVALPGGQRVDV